MKFSLFFIYFVASIQAFSQQVVDSYEQEIAFQNVDLILMDKGEVLEDQTLVVKNGIITTLGSSSDVKINDSALIIDGEGRYLMPGLAEMHAHVPPVEDIEQMKEVLTLFALNGITTIRGMLGHPKHLKLREMIRNREIIAPDFYTSGPSFNGQSVRSPEEAVAMVKQQKQAGYDYLKIHPGLTKESFQALAETAHEEGIPFIGHISFDVGIWNSIEAGYSSIDHMDGFVEGLVPDIDDMKQEEVGLFGIYVAKKADESQIPRLMDALKKKNVWVVPTQALAERWMSPAPVEQFLNAPEMKYMEAETRKKWAESKRTFIENPKYNQQLANGYIKLRQKLIKACNDEGVGLLLGCDAPQVFNVPGFSTHHELQYLVDAGLTPYEALRTGTVNVAEYLNRRGDSGDIKTGSLANLILLNGNPLQDISQTKNINGVLVGGRFLPKGYIDKELKRLEKK